LATRHVEEQADMIAAKLTCDVDELLRRHIGYGQLVK
jgi:hypothetical protein